MNEILTFTLIALLLVMSPGPNGVLIVKTASTNGRKPALFNILGFTVATFCHGALSILGLSALVLHSAELFLAVKIIGALYLLYIGLKTIYQVFNNSTSSTQQSCDDISIKKNNRTTRAYFVEGFLTQLLNPKVSMFYLAAFPQFLSFDQASPSHAFLLVTIHASLIFIWFLCVTQTISKLKTIAVIPSLGKWIQGVSGLVMVYFGSLLLTHKA